MTLVVAILLSLLLCVSSAFCDEGPLAESAYFQKRVTALSFRQSTNLNDRELQRQIPLKLGSVLSRSALDEAVQALYARAIFAHIDYELHEHEGGVGVVFMLVPMTKVGAIEFEGVAGLDERRLRGATGIRVGTRLAPAELNDSVDRLQRHLRERAYFNAFIAIRVIDRKGATDISLRYLVKLGERSVISEVEIEGDTPDELKPVQQALTDRYFGNAATKDQVRTFAQELRAELRNAGYWQASVRVEDTVFVPPRGARVTMKVVPREPFSVSFEGNTVYTTEELLAPLHLERRTVPFTPGAVASFCASLQERYQTAGYLFANIQCGSKAETDGRYIIRIVEGAHYAIDEIVLVGNESIRGGRIRGVMQTSRRGRWIAERFAAGHLVLSTLSSDVERIRELYRSDGYRDAKVFSEYTFNDERALVVTIRIEEGRKHVLQKLEIQHLGEDLPLEVTTLKSDLSLESDLTDQAVAEEVERLKNRVIDLGYPQTTATSQIDWEHGSVVIVIRPGIAVRVGKVTVKGNRFTHDRVLRRAVGIRPGDKWRLDEVSRGSSSLAETGLFRGIAVEPKDGVIDEPVEDLVIDVEERDTGVFDFGFALDTQDGLHLAGEVGQRNLGGRAESLTFLADLYLKTGGEIADAGRIRALYHMPSALGRDTDFYTEAFALFDIETIEEFSVDRVGLIPTVRTALSEHSSLDFGAMVFKENVYDVSPDVIIGPDDTGRAVYSFLRGQVDLDFRDDRYNPRKGSYTQIQTRIASEYLGSDSDLFSIGFQQSLYTPLTQRLVWSNSLRGSMIRGYRDTEVVPLSQRIFLGGRNSLRGFSRNKVGPRGVMQGIAGGDTSVLINTELQYDIVEDLVGVLFLDAGQSVLYDEGDFSGNTNSFSSLRYSPGFGARYRTPIGPVSVDYGFALDREFGERFGRLSIGIGNAW